jgi:hypothetical protein
MSGLRLAWPAEWRMEARSRRIRIRTPFHLNALLLHFLISRHIDSTEGNILDTMKRRLDDTPPHVCFGFLSDAKKD